LGRALARVAAALALVLAAASGTGCAHGPDPWEPFNRKVFAFNETADRYAVEPVARGWDFVVPGFLQTGLRNFFDHLELPVVLANDLLQLKPKAAAHDLLRLVTNTVFGLGGFIDVASREEVPKNDEDFGQTLGVWGVPRGPYLVLPLMGPSTPRQAAGMAVDSAGSVYSYFVPVYVSVAANGVNLVNLRAIYLEEVDQARREAFDYYVFVRNAYLQNLRARTLDGSAGAGGAGGGEGGESGVEPSREATDEDAEDLYYFDEEPLDEEDESLYYPEDGDLEEAGEDLEEPGAVDDAGPARGDGGGEGVDADAGADGGAP